jgi:hypothetical protein
MRDWPLWGQELAPGAFTPPRPAAPPPPAPYWQALRDSIESHLRDLTAEKRQEVLRYLVDRFKSDLG